MRGEADVVAGLEGLEEADRPVLKQYVYFSFSLLILAVIIIVALKALLSW